MKDVVLSVLPTWSTTAPLLVRFSPMEPALVPVAVPVLAVTVHVALGTAPTGTASVIDVVPEIPLLASAKFVVTTALTGSENVTVHDNGPDFTDCAAPARTIELTVGRVLSMVTVWLGAVPVLPAASSCVADSVRGPSVDSAEESVRFHTPD